MDIQEESGLRIIVTGVSSFIGYRIACRFAEKGYQVVGTVSKPMGTYDLLRRQRLETAVSFGVRISAMDITDPWQVRRLIAGEQPDVWIHHAEIGSRQSSSDYNLDEGHRVHVSPLPWIYEALKGHDCRGVIITGSGEEYSMLSSLSFEEDPCWPLTPYGLSKLTETMRAFQLSQQFELPTRIARVFIPYGPLNDRERILPRVLRALREGERIDLPSGTERRDFLHVDDISECYRLLVGDLRHREALFDIFNVCSGEGITLRSIVLYLASLLYSDLSLLQFGRSSVRKGETVFRAGSNDKAKGLLHWSPRSLAEGLHQYVAEENLL